MLGLLVSEFSLFLYLLCISQTQDSGESPIHCLLHLDDVLKGIGHQEDSRVTMTDAEVLTVRLPPPECMEATWNERG